MIELEWGYPNILPLLKLLSENFRNYEHTYLAKITIIGV